MDFSAVALAAKVPQLVVPHWIVTLACYPSKATGAVSIFTSARPCSR